MAITDHPLTQDHYDALCRVTGRCGKDLELARACKDCGLPFDDFIEQLTEQQRMSAALKSTFFPTRP